ncbi:MAG TPA: hypothetical protein VFB80_19685 [Pirellulaceae bacterium]|nr:hypothetical protein [Pirellulaceae bacterium]
MSWRWICLGCWLMAGGSGCARWVTTKVEPPSQLPQVKAAADAVMLDVAFVKQPAADVDSYDAIWAAADEQVLSTDLRRRLAANGLRAGVFGQDLPAPLRELLDNPTAESQGQEADAEGGEGAGSRRHLQVRTGVWKKVYASQTQPLLAVLLHTGGSVHGHQLTSAQCLFGLKTYPKGDGRVKLDLTPEIEHGELKPKFIRSEAQLVQSIGRDRLMLDELRIEALLSPGQWLLLSTTRDVKGLGENFFVDTPSGAVRRTLLLVRVAQTQLDDLFAPEQTSAPLATPGD